MDSVSFEEEPVYTSAKTQAKSKKPFFTSLVIAAGVVKTEKEANGILIGIAVIGILVTLYLLYVAVVPPHLLIPKSIIEADNAKLFKERPQ